jgi:hypothetical protein
MLPGAQHGWRRDKVLDKHMEGLHRAAKAARPPRKKKMKKKKMKVKKAGNSTLGNTTTSSVPDTTAVFSSSSSSQGNNPPRGNSPLPGCISWPCEREIWKRFERIRKWTAEEAAQTWLSHPWTKFKRCAERWRLALAVEAVAW